MADFPDNPTEGVEPTPADEVTDVSLAPTDDAAGGPQADPDAEIEEMSDEEAAAQLGQQI
ncbi:MAG: hypothetical protein EOO77_35850 [Oxalobacteraceae bacterium]|nr:MAG: hypothetical protein EOO77_35850 [Oxalobacteraceae bacterium]